MRRKDENITDHGRLDRLIKEMEHDPYMTRSKPREPTVCPECGVVFDEGRWQWVAEAVEGAQQEKCPACQRVNDKVPAGYLTLSGDFFNAHRDEIMNLVHNYIAAQEAQHPMKRLMAVEDQAGGVVITFTDRHLPRGVGEAIEHAYKGELEVQYPKEAGILRANWQR